MAAVFWLRNYRQNIPTVSRESKDFFCVTLGLEACSLEIDSAYTLHFPFRCLTGEYMTMLKGPKGKCSVHLTLTFHGRPSTDGSVLKSVQHELLFV